MCTKHTFIHFCSVPISAVWGRRYIGIRNFSPTKLFFPTLCFSHCSTWNHINLIYLTLISRPVTKKFYYCLYRHCDPKIYLQCVLYGWKKPARMLSIIIHSHSFFSLSFLYSYIRWGGLILFMCRWVWEIIFFNRIFMGSKHRGKGILMDF